MYPKCNFLRKIYGKKMVLSVVGTNMNLAIGRTEMCGGDLMVEIEIVVVDIFYRKN